MDEKASEQLAAAIAETRSAKAESSTKNRPIEDQIAEFAGIPAAEVQAKVISEAKQLNNRLGELQRKLQRHGSIQVVAFVLQFDNNVVAKIENLARAFVPGLAEVFLLVDRRGSEWVISGLAHCHAQGIAERVQQSFPNVQLRVMETEPTAVHETPSSQCGYELPEDPGGQVWIEIYTSSGHGGGAWDYGHALWSPRGIEAVLTATP